MTGWISDTAYASHKLTMKKISVIIPSYFEKEETILKAIKTLEHKKVLEIIIVESGTRAFSYKFLNSDPKIKAIQCKVRSRAHQMNEGAKESRGDFLLFMHADTLLSESCIDEALTLFNDENISLVSFYLKFDGNSKRLRFVERGAHIRNLFFRLPFGDQCFFVWRGDFAHVNGFDEVPILEDVKFVEKLKKIGLIKIARAHVTTSARRYEEKGVLRTSLRNYFIMILYYLGVPLSSLKRLY
jgi:rSAM/selenodomain-associated transferase 2